MALPRKRALAWAGACLLGAFVESGVCVGGFCPADLNLDCFVDGIDSDLFNNLFELGDPAADYNGDGFVDGIDYDQFNNDFERGCLYSDLTRDGFVNGLDACRFNELFGAGDLDADFTCDGVVNWLDEIEFKRVYGSEIGDWNRDGVLNCDDVCAFDRDFAAWRPIVDIDCDGFIDGIDYYYFTSWFVENGGPDPESCLPCP